MTFASCSEMPRSTLLSFCFEDQGFDEPDKQSDASALKVKAVAEHIQNCSTCRHIANRLRSSRQALQTLRSPEKLLDTENRVLTSTEDSAGHDRKLDPEAPRSGLRGRILGAAHDRAWNELSRHLQQLLEASQQLEKPHSKEQDIQSNDDRWTERRAMVGALARRLEGLGVHVDLSELPTTRPSAPAIPWVIRHLNDLLEIVGREQSSSTSPEEEAYQPSAAPSFLDSLPPL
ncbi:MAG: hypothetical protein P8N09_12140 [Planctomycetota bacterium]|jgi:hypothetical protein|nr:hypothetical protein [Planctomycetota bacterium]